MISTSRKRLRAFSSSIQLSEEVIGSAYNRFRNNTEFTSSASEWLQDNYYIVQRAVRQIRKDLPLRFYRQLPVLESAGMADQTRVYSLCRSLCTDDELDLTRMIRHLKNFQKTAELSIGEIWAIPSMLRYCNLQKLAESPAFEHEGAEDHETVASCIVTFRFLDQVDWKEFFEKVSLVERELRKDPAGLYSKMDFNTRNSYRNVIESLSRRTGISEVEIASGVVDLALKGPEDHVGFYLLTREGMKMLRVSSGMPHRCCSVPSGGRLALYLGFIVVITALTVILLASLAVKGGALTLQTLLVALFAIVPGSSVAIDVVNEIILHSRGPRQLPRMDFKRGIPSDCRTVVVIPTILGSREDIVSLVRQLEQHYLGNRDRNLDFALLSDFRDAPSEHMPEDAGLLEFAREEIGRLNRSYRRASGDLFHLFHRERLWNPVQKCWMGWERKRGKLMEFNSLLLGNSVRSSFSHGILNNIKFVITLDSDTVLPAGAAVRMISAMAHPLNAYRGNRGYSVLQPRVLPVSAGTGLSFFSRIYPGDFTVDLYSSAVSDVYQDLFAQGSYVGKGIYDLASFEGSLRGKVPENCMLSHDLFEGIQGRAGLLSDVVLYEEYPPNYIAYLYRLHRWVRGDWQLLPWLGLRVPLESGKKVRNTMSLLDRWKILDNLRRSLVEPSILALLGAVWILVPHASLYWTVVILLVMFRNPLMEMVVKPLRWNHRSIAHNWLRAVSGAVLLPLECFVKLHAVAVTLFRLTVSRKDLLQWTSAAKTSSMFKNEFRRSYIWQRMSFVPLFAVILFTVLYLTGSQWVPMALPFLILWFLSPEAVLAISRHPAPPEPELSRDELTRLRKIAARTWRFFDTFVGPEGHWLPPDHYQEDPLARVAYRTSPTNIGLFLLSVMSAMDMGYIGLMDFVLRLSYALGGMKDLERHRGHLLNWYDTRSLQPLPPRYVSTVDSGNLACSLVALARGCTELEDVRPISRARWQALMDTILLLMEVIVDHHIDAPELYETMESMNRSILKGIDDPDTWLALLLDLCERHMNQVDRFILETMESAQNTLSVHVITELRTWSDRIRMHLADMLSETGELYPWMSRLARPPSLFSSESAGTLLSEQWEELCNAFIPWASPNETISFAGDALLKLERMAAVTGDLPPSKIRTDSLAWCGELEGCIRQSIEKAEGIKASLKKLRRGIARELSGMGFGFLYDQRRKVFHIGYNVETEHLDANYYDLLASEARLASLMAIARGDVPVDHWLHLSRPLTVASGMMSLVSWSGTMFEYLMPLIFTGNSGNSILGQSCSAAVKHQMVKAAGDNTPWGISESCYYLFDPGNQYQYRAFGVPGLGFKRGLAEDMVIAPYASMLALSIEPGEVMKNADSLTGLGMTGSYGFYESMDYTPSRLPAGKEYMIIKSYMAHHQGMILLSIVNFLKNDVMAGRFLSEPMIRVVELLLQEQMPLKPPIVYSQPEPPGGMSQGKQDADLVPWSLSGQFPVPRVHLLSNGSYSTVLTDSGGGFSSWNRTKLTGWKADTTRDSMGNWIYLKDVETNLLWSAARQPAGSRMIDDSIHFLPQSVKFISRENGITTTMEVIIDPDEDAEIRRIHVLNNTDAERSLFVCSCSEVVLVPVDDSNRHPAFNKMFIVSEFLPKQKILMFTRRKRDPEEADIFFGQIITGKHEVTWEADRMAFLGRGGSAGKPAALSGETVDLSETAGEMLDPVMCMGTSVELDPHGSTELFYVTMCSMDPAGLIRMAEKYRASGTIEKAFLKAETAGKRELAARGLTCSDLERMQPVISALLYPSAALRAPAALLESNTMGQRDLWRFGISGDFPIFLVSVDTDGDHDLLSDLLKMHSFWRNMGVLTDFVILNTEESGYNTELQGKLSRILAGTGGEKWLNCRGGVFFVRKDQISSGELILLKTWARVILDCSLPLETQLKALSGRPVRLPDFVPILAATDHNDIPLSVDEDLLFFNGAGGFTQDGSEYVIFLEDRRWTPLPWINVISNPSMGFIASESGLGCSWAFNSGENRLSPWSNDPVTDSTGEAVYIRDEETGVFWSPSPLPVREGEPYLIRHGAGYTSWEHNSHGLMQKMTACIADGDPVKTVIVHLENPGSRNRRISVTFYMEPVLGTDRSVTEQFITGSFNPSLNALFACNTAGRKPPGGMLFLVSSRIPNGLTTDRTEFLGRSGSMGNPAALHRTGLSGTIRTGLSSCLALQVVIWIGPGERKEVTFLLGQGRDSDDAASLIEKNILKVQDGMALRDIKAMWNRILGSVQVNTPDAAINIILNRWLLYQTLSCRIWGRTALYQSSGAYGFRDQLQDCMALCNSVPEEFRKHILRCASNQFLQGDVLHWWHPPHPVGVRTRCSDDLLWLPYAAALYIMKTGDDSILYETVPFLEGNELGDGELERYAEYSVSERTASLHQHCLLALERGTTAGIHGLPLMGTHDWNDGMNRVGSKGKGESVWLGWFLYDTLKKYKAVCIVAGDDENAVKCESDAIALKSALQEHAWDGNWYLRAFNDNGSALGSAADDECRIASIAQSWAVISGAGDETRNETAMNSVVSHLADNVNGILLLFTPPFDKTETNPGYIMGYPPGVRENGGQYTHAAAWAVWALALLGRGDTAESLFRFLNPVYHSDSARKRDVYRVEPYVAAADVYSAPGLTGRGGWTWYTGASGWLYRTGIEAILGITVEGDRLSVNPCIPKKWKGFTAILNRGASSWHITVANPLGVSKGVLSVKVDGAAAAPGAIQMGIDGSDHFIEVEMG